MQIHVFIRESETAGSKWNSGAFADGFRKIKVNSSGIQFDWNLWFVILSRFFEDSRFPSLIEMIRESG